MTSTSRVIFTRSKEDSIMIKSFETGETVLGCCVICNAPSCLPAMNILPCFGDSKYVAMKKDASKYVFLRENSIEFNNPTVSFKTGNYCCIDPCQYVINDNVQVIYFDDPIFENMNDQNDTCSSLYFLCFGSQGERIYFENRCCFSCCIQGSLPCPMIPICCPRALCPCYISRDIYLKNAQKAMYEIKKARSVCIALHRQDEKHSNNMNTTTTTTINGTINHHQHNNSSSSNQNDMNSGFSTR